MTLSQTFPSIFFLIIIFKRLTHVFYNQYFYNLPIQLNWISPQTKLQFKLRFNASRLLSFLQQPIHWWAHLDQWKCALSRPKKWTHPLPTCCSYYPIKSGERKKLAAQNTLPISRGFIERKWQIFKFSYKLTGKTALLIQSLFLDTH